MSDIYDAYFRGVKAEAHRNCPSCKGKNLRSELAATRGDLVAARAEVVKIKAQLAAAEVWVPRPTIWEGSLPLADARERGGTNV